MSKKLICLVSFVLALGLVLTSTANAVDPNLVGWWMFDETSGTTARDSSGNNNHGTVNGAFWTNGYYGGALKFDGINNSVTFGTGPSLNGATDFSLAAWIKTSASNGVIIQQRSPGGYNGAYRFMVAGNGTLNFLIYGGDYQFGGNFQTTKTVNDDQWHHVTAIRQGDSGYIYIDGNQEASASGTLRDLDDSIETAVGAEIRRGDSRFNGIIDNIHVYKQALTEAEINLVMATAMLAPPAKASAPNPTDGATDVDRYTVLVWESGEYAVAHDVYFGTDFNDVNEASSTDTSGVLISPAQDPNTFEPGRLTLETT